jgi:hypothetical protein
MGTCSIDIDREQALVLPRVLDYCYPSELIAAYWQYVLCVVEEDDPRVGGRWRKDATLGIRGNY